MSELKFHSALKNFKKKRPNSSDVINLFG